MKYIRKIILKNFQSHQDTEIELNDKLNIIVGPSDSGKTAIMRAMKWALYNEPSGDYFIKEGENEVSVSLIFSDNTQLTRYRSKTKNVYELLYNNGEELRLEGFGTGVPEEIIEAIGIYKINLDGKETSSISFGEQLEGPFLLSEKTSTRASAIGQLVGVDVIDEALREVLKDVRTLNVTKKNIKDEIYQLNEELKTFDYLDGLKATIKDLSDIRDSLSISQKKKDKLSKSNHTLIKLNDELYRLETIKSKLEKVDEIENIISSLENSNAMFWHLNNYYRKLNRIDNEIKNNESLLKQLEYIDSSINIEKKLLSLVKEYSRLLTINLKYAKIKEEIVTLKMDISIMDKYLIQEEKVVRIQDVVDKLKILINSNIRFQSAKSSIYKGNKYLEKFKDFDNALEQSKLLENKIELLRQLNKLSYKNATITKEIAFEEIHLKEIKNKNEELIKKYKVILSGIEKCPLCYSEIDNNRIEHIMNHYIGG